jgi:hypothetical protein
MGTRKPHWIGRWAGGRIKQTADGQQRWVIERERGGKLYVIPLDVTNEQQAQNHYERFKADIDGYLQAVQAKKTRAARPGQSDRRKASTSVCWLAVSRKKSRTTWLASLAG